MCDPATLTIAAVAVSAATSVYQGVTTMQADRYNAQVADQNAGIAERNSQLTIQAGYDEQRRQYQRVEALKGQQIAGFAAEGLDVSFGSPADIIGDTAVGGEQDALKLRQNNMAQANSFLVDASNYRSEAKGLRTAGTTALVTGFLKAGSTVLGSADTLPGMGGGGPKSVAGMHEMSSTVIR